MKKSKVISVLAAAVLASSAAVSVSAVDYGVALPLVTRPGSTGETPAPSTTVSADGTTTTVAAHENTVVSANSVARAAASGKAISASYSDAAVKSNAIAALAKVDGGVLNVKTKRFTVSISADSITEVKDINLGMKITKNSKKGALILRTKQKGSYGCTVEMAIPAKIYEQAGVDLDKAQVYTINDGKAEVYSDVQVSNGDIVFDITDGGTYIIL